MPLREGFPSKELLEKEGYASEQDVSEATDEELLEIEGIGPVKLDEIRSVAPFKESESLTGTGETSGLEKPDTSQSVHVQTSGLSKDQTDPHTGQDLPKGIVKNERGTLTASSTVDQSDMVHPNQIKAERDAALRHSGEKIAALLGS